MNLQLKGTYAWSAIRVLQQYGLDVNMNWIAGGYTVGYFEQLNM
jgi:hypothetical protein